MLVFSHFSTMFSTHPKNNIHCQVAFILSSANALSFDHPKNLSFGKELLDTRNYLLLIFNPFPHNNTF